MNRLETLNETRFRMRALQELTKNVSRRGFATDHEVIEQLERYGVMKERERFVAEVEGVQRVCVRMSLTKQGLELLAANLQ